MASLPPLPNPLTPLAWLPEDIADQLEASRYLYSATVGAWIWDLLMSFHEEYRVFTKHRIVLSDVVYILARMTSFGFILSALIFQVGKVDNCHTLAKTIGWFGAFAMPLNSLLFFFRVRAVFHQNTYIVFAFALLWLATLGCITAPFGVDGIHIGTTQACVNSDVKSFSSAGIIIVAVHDTIVFLAISTRLLMHSLAHTWTEKFKAFFGGSGMGSVSKVLFTSGQLYYLATVGVNIVAMVVILSPSVPPVFRAMFSIPNVALQNAMACRVFRQLKLGLIRDSSITSTGNTNATPIRLVPTMIDRSQNSGKTYAGSNTLGSNTTVGLDSDGGAGGILGFKASTGDRKEQFVMQVGINQETQVNVDPESLKPPLSKDGREWP